MDWISTHSSCHFVRTLQACSKLTTMTSKCSLKLLQSAKIIGNERRNKIPTNRVRERIIWQRVRLLFWIRRIRNCCFYKRKNHQDLVTREKMCVLLIIAKFVYVNSGTIAFAARSKISGHLSSQSSKSISSNHAEHIRQDLSIRPEANPVWDLFLSFML